MAKDVGGYLSGLHRYQRGELDAWVGWFADTVGRAAEAALAWTDEVAGLLDQWRQRLADLRRDSTALRIVHLLPERPVISAAVAADRLGVSERAARSALEILAARGIVEPYERRVVGPGRPARWWVARGLVDLVQGWTD